MIENKGFIKLYRSIIKWRWFHDANTLKLFIYLLCRANIADADFETITVHRGELVTSVKSLAKNLNFTVSQTRTALKHLNLTNEIAIKSYSKYSVISLLNYNSYQDNLANKMTNKSQTDDKQIANKSQQIKNNKNNKKNKNGEKGETPPKKDAFGSFKNVYLTESEYEKLKSDYPGDYSEKIERLSCYIQSSGKTYSDHYATIKKWAIEDKDKPKPAVSGGKTKDSVYSSNATYDLKAYEEYSMFDEMDD